MGFFLYDLIFLIIFCALLAAFLIRRRRKLKREGVLILYRTKLGIRVINQIAKKYRKFLHSFEPVLIFTGYCLMVGMLILLFQLMYVFIKFPDFIRAVKIPPLMPLIPYIPKIFKVEFLPPFYFTYWIIVLAIAAISHEFFHGIFARARGVKIKSTGFAFLGPFTGAFVEPDENKVKKLKIKNQLAFLSAGTFANVVMTLFFFAIMWLFFISVFSPAGVIFDDYTYSLFPIANITMINGISLKNPSYEQVSGLVNGTVIVSINGEVYDNGVAGFSKDKKGIYYIEVYQDTPALKSGLAGVIIELDDKEIKMHEDLKEILSKKNPGDEIKIKTLIEDEIKEYELELGERPDDENRAYLGIALRNTEGAGLLGKIRNKVLFFKDPNTYYKPKFNGDFMIFIYNLIWWIVLINFSVALVNMLPLGIFDGGRVFFLSVLAITKSEKIAKNAYKFATFFLLFIFLFLMFLWFVNFAIR